MGQFSWKTQDTNKPIYNDYDKFTVFMVDPRDGTAFKETDYDGYGVFGGVDFYELSVRINKDKLQKCNPCLFEKIKDFVDKPHQDLNEEEIRILRGVGIDIYFSHGKDLYTFPILVEEYSNWELYKGQCPEDDENQGWHTDSDNDECNI